MIVNVLCAVIIHVLALCYVVATHVYVIQTLLVGVMSILTQRYGTRAGSFIPAVRFYRMSAQTFNVVVYGEYTDSCKLPSASITRNCNYSRIEQQ